MLYYIEAIGNDNAICVNLRKTEEEAKNSILDLKQQGMTVTKVEKVSAEAWGLDWYAAF